MRTQSVLFFSIFTFILGIVIIPAVQSSPSNFFEDDDSPSTDYNDYLDNDLERILYVAVKRDSNSNNCIPKGGSCDNRPSDCCDYTSCRCNLWGANCRCQRRGIISQKWGK